MVFEKSSSEVSSNSTSPLSTMHTSDSDTDSGQRINTEQRELYFHYEAIASKLAGKDGQFKNAAARAAASSHAASDAASTLAQLREVELQLSHRMQALQARKLRNKLFPRRAGSAQAKVRQSLEEAAEEAAVAKQLAAEAAQQAGADAQNANMLKRDAHELKVSERSRRRILEAVYGGPDAGSSKENLVESEKNRLAEDVMRSKDQLDAQKYALKLLRAAAIELDNAKKNLQGAQVSNTMDLLSGGGIGLLAGVRTQVNVKTAAQQTRSAGEKIERAAQLNKKLPIVKLAKAQDGFALAFVDVFLDGLVTDLIVRSAVEKAVKSVNAVGVSLKESLIIQSRVVDNLNARYKGHTRDLNRASEELVDLRAALIRNV